MPQVLWPLYRSTLLVGLIILLVAACGERPFQTPTAAPVAIPIATGPCPTAAERAYLLDLDKRLIGIGNATTDLQTSLSHPGLPADPEAKTGVLIWTASILLLDRME